MRNFPSEKIYTVPEKYGVNGRVCATIPLVYQGSLIEGMRLEFREGRVVNASASSGQERLEALLSVDEGARYLGEVALVPADSSIRRVIAARGGGRCGNEFRGGAFQEGRAVLKYRLNKV